MRKQERLNRILELVVAKGNLEVEVAAKELKVSVATVRRDFDELAIQNLVSRSHGAVTAMGSSLTLPLTYKVAKNGNAKLQIAQKAVEMVERYQTIGLNGGTTTSEVARALASHSNFAADNDLDRPALTVLTNAVNIAAELTVRPQIRIVVTGGVARTRSFELTGPLVESALDEFALDIAFLGIEAFDLELGALARYTDEARVNRAIAKRAAKVTLVTTSDKFNQRTFSVILKPEEIDCIITDENIDDQTVNALESKGIDIVIA
jgi:DeoR family transcriptional regulator, aga operon transcriptional repressor